MLSATEQELPPQEVETEVALLVVVVVVVVVATSLVDDVAASLVYIT